MRIIRIIATVGALVTAAAPAVAQDWPNHAMTLAGMGR
jgi:hypothetical protein